MHTHIYKHASIEFTFLTIEHYKLFIFYLFISTHLYLSNFTYIYKNVAYNNCLPLIYIADIQQPVSIEKDMHLSTYIRNQSISSYIKRSRFAIYIRANEVYLHTCHMIPKQQHQHNNRDRRIYAAAWMHVHLLFPFTQLFSIEPFHSFIAPEAQPCPLFPLYALIPLR